MEKLVVTNSAGKKFTLEDHPVYSSFNCFSWVEDHHTYRYYWSLQESFDLPQPKGSAREAIKLMREPIGTSKLVPPFDKPEVSQTISEPPRYVGHGLDIEVDHRGHEFFGVMFIRPKFRRYGRRVSLMEHNDYSITTDMSGVGRYSYHPDFRDFLQAVTLETAVTTKAWRLYEAKKPEIEEVIALISAGKAVMQQVPLRDEDFLT